MTALGIICTILAVADGMAAITYAMRDDIVPALMLAANFFVLGGMVQLKVFG